MGDDKRTFLPGTGIQRKPEGKCGQWVIGAQENADLCLFALSLVFREVRATLLERMAGTTKLELATSVALCAVVSLTVRGLVPCKFLDPLFLGTALNVTVRE